MKKFLKIVFILLILLGCKKDKLVGDYSILEGNWKWDYTLKRTYNRIYNTESIDTIYASQYSNTYEVEFLHEGKIYFKKNGEIEEKYRIIFNHFIYEGYCMRIYENAWSFRVKLNNRKKNTHGGCVNQDTLSSTHPFLSGEFTDYSDYPLEIGYFHIFIRN